MNGITIFMHSFRQVLGNLAMAARISGGLWIILIIAAVAYGVIVALSGSVFFAIMFGIAMLIALIWGVSLIAVLWHRFILREERPSGFIPSAKGLPVWPYFWYGFGIAIIVFILLFVILLIAGLFMEPGAVLRAFDQQNVSMELSDIGLRAVISILATALYLRLALVLPSVALEEKVTIGESWGETKPFLGAIVMVAILLTVFNGVVMVIFGLVMSSFAPDGAASVVISLLLVLFQWFYFMLNISILSTLFGHIVQKRDIY